MNLKPVVKIIRETNKIILIPREDLMLTERGVQESPQEGTFYFVTAKNLALPYELNRIKVISINPGHNAPLKIKIASSSTQFSGENRLELISGEKIAILKQKGSTKQLDYGPRLSVKEPLVNGTVDFSDHTHTTLDVDVDPLEIGNQVSIKGFFNVHGETGLRHIIKDLGAEKIETEVVYEEEETITENGD